MEYIFVGKKNVVSDALKERTIEKLSKVERLLPDDTKMTITFNVVRDLQKVEVTAPLGKRTLRAVAADTDMYDAVDEVAEIVEGQVVKYKSRLKEKGKSNKQYEEEFIENFAEGFDDVQELISGDIVKTKVFNAKPMTADEAILELELLDHNFYVYIDGADDEVAVLYKRDDDGYGIIKMGR